jgi:hypothetical protein
MTLSFLNRCALVGLLGLAATGPALAEWRDIPYAEVAKMPLVLKQVDPQGIYRVSYLAQPGPGQTALPADLKLRVKAGDQTVPVAIRPDGHVELPIRQDWADAGALLQANQPKGRVKLSISLDSRTPPGTRMSYAQLTESAPVMERGIRKVAGIMSFLAPKVRGLVLHFEKGAPQTVTLLLPDGKRKVWKTNADGHATVPWEPDWLAATVELSAPLVGVDRDLR